MTVFALTTVRGPGWDAERSIRAQPLWDEHALFMDDLVDDGRILLGGPIADADPTVVALIAIEAEDEQEVRGLFARDPWVDAGVMALGTIRPWTIWLRPESG